MSAERTALVTGAGSGIGRAVALALLEEGWRVALTGRNTETLEEARALAGPAAHRALVAPADVTDPVAVDRLFATLGERFGRLDLLFNNAGINRMGAPDELSIADWNAVIATNLTGAFLCAQGAFRMMRAQSPKGGRIINNGSVSAHAPRPNQIAYTATKHAITGLTKSLSLDGRAHDIACGQIDIGNALTPLAARMQTGALQPNGAVLAEATMDVAQVARSVLFMASLPLDANVQTLTVMATKMPFVGRG